MKQFSSLIFCITLWSLATSLYSQNSSVLYFRLHADEATKLYQQPHKRPDSTFFHSIIAQTQAEREPGHYLKVVVNGEYANAYLYTTSPLQLEVINNRHDLSILVKDTLGGIVPTASVKLGQKKIPFDAKTQSFHVRRSPKARLLEIQAGGMSTYYELERNEPKPLPVLAQYDRFSRSRIGHILTWPLKIIHEPIRYVARSIRSNYWRLPWKDWFGSSGQNIQGFIALSQPIYRQNDTLKMKAYVSTKHGRPLNGKINLLLAKRWAQPILRQKIKPERPGVYLFEWPLADSLDIDENYYLQLSRSKRNENLHQSFGLEDYELEEINYELKASSNSFYKGEKCSLSLSAKTTNNLTVPDASAEIFILAGNIQEFHATQVLVPDTLWQSKENLGLRGEWQVVLPDSLFPAVSMNLRCKVYFNSSNGQLVLKEKSIDFYDQPRFKLSLEGAEVVASSTSAIRDSLILETFLSEGYTREEKILLPLRFPLNPNVISYTLRDTASQLKSELDLDEEEDLMAIGGQRSADSIHLYLKNPRKLPFWYQIKTHAGLIESGFSQDSLWGWQKQDKSANFYHLYFQYQWGTEIYQRNQEFRHYPKALSLQLQGPEQVIPGQENSYTIQVKRGSGRPAKGVELSTGAINAQFGETTSYNNPTIGYRRQLSPSQFPTFELDEKKQTYHLPITRHLTQRFQIQHSLYYQYRYSNQLLLSQRDSSLKQDSFYQRIAQFAPFVVKEGKMQPIFLIYLNRKLAYYYEAGAQHPYSFLASAGYHQITLRTREYEYTLDSLYLRLGEKLELVINEDFWTNGTTTRIKRAKVEPSFSPQEQKLIERSIFVLKNLRSKDSIFVWDDPRNIHFATYHRAAALTKIGPFTSGSNLHFLNMNQFKTAFTFEPGFSYVVEKNRERLYQLLPSHAKKELLPISLAHPPIGQFVYSPQAIRTVSPPRKSILFDKMPEKYRPAAGKYQFFYPNDKFMADPTRLYLVVLHNLLTEDTLLLPPDTRVFPYLSTGEYELLLFRKDESVFRKKFQVYRDTLVYENLKAASFQKIAALLPAILGKKYITTQAKLSHTLNNAPVPIGETKLVTGRLLDDSGQPLIGASILVKGTSTGTVTDLDGNYSLEVPVGQQNLVISYTGYTTQEISVDDPNYGTRDLQMETAMDLSEMVVTGYSTTQRRQATGAILAGRTAGINLRGLTSRPLNYYIDGIRVGTAFSDTISASGIRKSFHDHAFWQPLLRSNRRGETQFKVKFPDDITTWKVFVLGADKNRQAGIYTGNIQSYKPLMAQLNTPRFLVHGDQTTLNGKVLNYTQDSFSLRSYFQRADQVLQEKQSLIKEALIEKMEFQAPQTGDSLKFRFALETQQGYTDGEERKLPLRPVGSLETQGNFMVLERDTVLHFANQEGKIQFKAQASAFHLLLEDVQYLKDYPYDCNEQTASRLMGLLAEKQICQALQKPFNAEKLIRSAIARLDKAQNQDGSWGWWPNTEANLLMSNHVLQALIQAQQAGYHNNAVEKGLRWLFNAQPFENAHDLLSLFQTIILAKQKIALSPDLLDTLRKPKPLLHDQLLSLLIQQKLGLNPSLDSFFNHRKLDVYGGAFWEERNGQNWDFHWYNHRLSNTLLAYQIAQNADLKEEMRRIRIHLLANRGYTQNGARSLYGWRNTLEVASVLKTILPDLLAEKALQTSTLTISGALNETLKQGAFQATFDASQPLALELSGAGPFFCTTYQQSWNINPQPKSDLFKVKSHLEYQNEEIKQLQFGQPAQLVVEIEVKQEAQYVMIEIPIPAGCSYFQKPQTYRSPEVHREYFADKVSIFCERLPVGKQRFTIDLEPRFSGTYTLNPVRVEEMYFPVLYGRNGVEKVSVKP